MSSKSTVQDTSVVYLKTYKDWPRWIALNKTRATQKGVWEFIDPDVATPPLLVEPVQPKPKKANGELVTLQELTQSEVDLYRIEKDDWKIEKKAYDKKKEALTDIEDHVIRTAGAHWSAIEKKEGLHARLVALKARVAPTNYAREQDALKRWELANQNAQSTRTTEWLVEWEAALEEAKLFDLPDVQGIRPTRRFLKAVEGIAPAFSQHWANQIETLGVTQPTKKLEDEIPSGTQIATIFRNLQPVGRSSKGSFASTLQGEPAPKDSEQGKI
jgi:hypothetical protein